MKTTVNNHVEQVGGIEKAREIVSGAPDECSYYGLINNIVIYYQWCEEWLWHNPNTNEYERDFSKSMKFSLNDLRTAIAKHDATLTNEGTKQLESDDCTDICNHVSLNTKVVDL